MTDDVRGDGLSRCFLATREISEPRSMVFSKKGPSRGRVGAELGPYASSGGTGYFSGPLLGPYSALSFFFHVGPSSGLREHQMIVSRLFERLTLQPCNKIAPVT